MMGHSSCGGIKALMSRDDFSGYCEFLISSTIALVLVIKGVRGDLYDDEA